MPQMAPISWLSLFIIFSMTMIIFSILNYFSYTMNKSSSIKKNSFNKFYLNWKW